MNREEWLTTIAEQHVWPLLESAGAARVSNYRVSVGFPKGSRGGKGAIGQAWPEQISADQTREVFISPVLSADRAVETLIHELIHVSLNNEHNHRGPFKQIAQRAGLTGKMTATVADTGLKQSIANWLASFVPYPHAALSPTSDAPKPGSRLIKCVCSQCGYTVRTTQKWIDIGPPICPLHEAMEIEFPNAGE